MGRGSVESRASPERRRVGEFRAGDPDLTPPRPAEDAGDDPLAGVLERLLARERGGPVAASKSLDAFPSAGAVPRPAPARMLVVAGLGGDGGEAALRSAAQWAVLLGRRVAISDCFGAVETASGSTPGVDEPGLPRVRVSCAPDRLALMRADVVAAVLDRLRRHERAADLLLLRMRARERVPLMRAVFLARGMVVPLDESGLGIAIELSRDILRSFADVTLWPFSETSRTLRRYTDALRGFGEAGAVRFDPGELDLARALDALPGPPEEGFLASLLLPAAADVPAELLRFDSFKLS